MIDRTTFQRISKRIEGYEQDMIRLQFALTAIPALAPENGGDGEMKRRCFLPASCAIWGFPRWRDAMRPTDGSPPASDRT
jgi:succinyl-diaminopimelate desuccinylase